MHKTEPRLRPQGATVPRLSISEKESGKKMNWRPIRVNELSPIGNLFEISNQELISLHTQTVIAGLFAKDEEQKIVTDRELILYDELIMRMTSSPVDEPGSRDPREGLLSDAKSKI